MRGISADVNLLGFVAAEAAYEGGERWLGGTARLSSRASLTPIEQAAAPLARRQAGKDQATYLAWIDGKASLGLG